MFVWNVIKAVQIYISVCRIFTRNKEKIQTFKETGDSWYIYQNELEKICFQDEMAYGDFKYWNRRTSDKILCDKVFNVPKNSKYTGYQKGLASMVYIFFSIEELHTGTN